MKQTLKTAVIIGSQGQDGRLLSEHLRTQGYTLIGIDVGSETDICDPVQVSDLVKKVRPAEIYHLAAYHQSSEGHSDEGLTSIHEFYRINVFSLLNCLEAIRISSPATRLFYAASSHVFGEPKQPLQNEETPLSPVSAYGITKTDGLNWCRSYRERYGIFASTGILYNHESPLRGPSFLSKKIMKGALDIRDGKAQKLILGNLSAEADWGYAPDYVEAMHKMLTIDRSSEFIVATGIRHTVQDFVEIAFGLLDLDWRQYVEENPSVIKRIEGARIGDAAKLKAWTGWKPKIDFREMVGLLLDAEKGGR